MRESRANFTSRGAREWRMGKLRRLQDRSNSASFN
jgi:hypothetical protein